MNYNKEDLDFASANTGSEEDYNNTKRSRMLSAFQLTKNVYLPTVGLSLKQLTSDASTSFKRYYNGNGSSSSSSNPDLDYQTIGNGVNANQLLLSNNNNLDDLEITIYNSYTYFNKLDNKYVTEIKGNICLFNSLSRKNRWVYMGLKKLIIGSNKEEFLVQRDLEILNSITSQAKYEQADKEMDLQPSSSQSSLLQKNSTIFDSRIYPFLNKGVSSFPLVLKLNDIGLEHCLSRPNGDFEFTLQTDDDISLNENSNKLSIMTNLRPQSIVMQKHLNTQEFQSGAEDFVFEDFTTDIDLIHYSQNHEIAVISDIDDTIKFTGVVEGKKIALDTTFNKPIESWLFPSMANWYKLLKFKYNVDFFYVSNSPQQLYPSLREYVDCYYPNGTIVLKEYLHSNIFSNFLGSSATKKLERILTVIDQFSYKKFILIGDSGQSDLEAYIQVCKMRPSNVIGIYIKAVDGSLSDYIDREDKTVVEFNKTINEKYYRLADKQKDDNFASAVPILPPRNPAKFQLDVSAEVPDELSSPISDNLKSSQPPPPPPPRNSSSKRTSMMLEKTSEIYSSGEKVFRAVEDTLDFDKKRTEWNYRIGNSIMDLRSIYGNTQNRIQLQFFQDELIEESCKLIERVKNKT